MTTNKCTKHTKQKLANTHTHRERHACMPCCQFFSLSRAFACALQAICSFCVAYFLGRPISLCVLHFTFLSSCQLPSGRVSYDPHPTPSLALLPRPRPSPTPPLSACKCALNTQQADKRLQQQILHLNCVSNCWTCLKLQLNQLHPVPGPTPLPLPSSCTWHKLQQNLAKYKYKYECLCKCVCVCVFAKIWLSMGVCVKVYLLACMCVCDCFKWQLVASGCLFNRLLLRSLIAWAWQVDCSWQGWTHTHHTPTHTPALIP